MKNKKKVIHIINTLERGGAEMSLLRMLPLLNEDIESIFITLKKSGSLAQESEKRGVSVIALDQKTVWDIVSYWRLIKTIKEISPQLIVTHLLYSDFIGRFILQSLLPYRVLSSVATTYNFPRYWPARIFEKLTHPFCSGYIANSHSVKKAYVEKFRVPEDKVTVLQTGMDTEYFSNLKPNERLREELGILPGDVVIICVANLHPNKGHSYLLSAFEQVYKNTSNSKLLIVGDGIEKANLLRQVEAYQSKDAILFLGKRSDVPDLLTLSDIFALATFFEGMCNAIMEGMSSGIPTLTTDIVENRELVTHEKTGLLCPLKDSECLARSLERLIQDKELRLSLGSNAAQEMKEKYGLQATKDRWKTFFLSH